MEKLKKLVEDFKEETKGKKNYKIIDEENTKITYINKFFEVLGWQISQADIPASQRDVEFEASVKTKKVTKKPDYAFKYGQKIKFYVEAKRPSIDIETDIDSAFQIRSYGFSGKTPLGILTDFEEFAVYDTRLEPNEKDPANVGRIKYFTFEDYLEKDKIEWIYNTFSKEAVANGSLEKYESEVKKPKGTIDIDRAFLNMLDNWRLDLARELANRNKDLTIYELNEAVQKLIDRLLFLRIAEDRGAEDYQTLLDCASQDHVQKALYKVFEKAEEKYNSGLFKKSGLIQNLEFKQDFLKRLIRSTYPKKCPFRFNIMPIEIIGAAYEQFLGKTIYFTQSHRAQIAEKPEVRKAGGVYYTPQYIVNYIVENTAGEKIKNKTPKQIEKLKILDPACGSGSFLIGAYTYLLDYHLDYFTKEENRENAIKRNLIFEYSPGEHYLTIDVKRKILLNNIYGVDIDAQATEVTKLSLLLKLLEHENKDTIDSFLKHSQMQPLPDLSENIKCGNSLIGTDIYEKNNSGDKNQPELFKDKNENEIENLKRDINAFDWNVEYPGVFHKELSRFHHITFETKYSRKRMKNKEPVILTEEDRIDAAKAISEKAAEMKVKVLACSILPDHVHLIIADMGEDISTIMNNVKGYTSYYINKKNRNLKDAVEKEYEKAKSAKEEDSATVPFRVRSEKVKSKKEEDSSIGSNGNLKDAVEKEYEKAKSAKEENSATAPFEERLIEKEYEKEKPANEKNSATVPFEERLIEKENGCEKEKSGNEEDSATAPYEDRLIEKEYEKEKPANEKNSATVPFRVRPETDSGGKKTETRHIWAKGYSGTYLDTEEHLFNAIEYVNNNYLKHFETWGEPQNILLQIISDFITPFKSMEQFEYESGGFDVVIGNPPYIGFHGYKEGKHYLKSYYRTASGKFDIYNLFIEKSFYLLNKNAILSFICPNTFMKRKHGKELRNFILSNLKIIEIVDFEHSKIFKDAMNYTGVYIFSKEKNINNNFKFSTKLEEKSYLYSQDKLDAELWIIQNPKIDNLITKILDLKRTKLLENFVNNISEGIVTGLNDLYLLNENQLKNNKFETKYFKPCLRGKNIRRYYFENITEYVFYPYNKNNEVITEDEFKTNCPIYYNYLKQNKNRINSRDYFKKSSKKWYELWNSRNVDNFENIKIVVAELADHNRFMIDKDYYYYGDTVCGFYLKNNISFSIKYLLSLLNSTFIEWFYKKTTVPKANNFYIYKTMFLKTIPIFSIDFSNPEEKKQHDDLVSLVDTMLDLQEKYHKTKSDNEKTRYYRQITFTDNQIDKLVYSLYGLTEEEIKIVEESAEI